MAKMILCSLLLTLGPGLSRTNIFRTNHQCRESILCIVWMHHLSIQKANGLWVRQEIEVGHPGGRKDSGIELGVGVWPGKM